uniref:Putative ovule protein n=1 Tax=Solanum chacoense TaxID=4108 RepID=A0A0V0GSP7_SOLCH
MTEFDGICNPIGRKHRGGTVGKPFSAVQANIFLNNESGSDKTGVRELCIKGPSSFRNIGSYLSQLGNHLPIIGFSKLEVLLEWMKWISHDFGMN